MNKKIVFSTFFVVLILLGGLGVLFSFAWYPGLTQKETARILLEDRKFGGRALWKAQWHGSELFDDLASLTNDFSQVHGYQALTLAKFFNGIETTSLGEQAHLLYHQSSLEKKIIGALILSKSADRFDDPELIRFLSQLVTRTYPELKTDYYQEEKYVSEVAMLALGNMGGTGSFQVLVDVIQETPVPYLRHQIACQALAYINNPQGILILRDAILNKEFHAVLPAYRALVTLGDPQAKDVVRKRLAMKWPSDDKGFMTHIKGVIEE